MDTSLLSGEHHYLLHTPHTSHPSHITPHSSHTTPLTHHTHYTPHSSHTTPHSPHTLHPSHITPHHLTHYPSLLTPHLSLKCTTEVASSEKQQQNNKIPTTKQTLKETESEKNISFRNPTFSLLLAGPGGQLAPEDS